MAGFCRQRADSFTLDFQNSSGDVAPNAVLSPITELSMNFEHNSISMGKTPKRKLSLSNCDNASPSPCFLRTMSNESGYCPDSPMWPSCESPTIELLRSTADMKKSFHLRRPSFRRWNSSPAGCDESDKENINSPLVLQLDGCEGEGEADQKEEFVFARPRVPSFVRRFSKGRLPPQRSLSDPLSEQVSPARSDSVDSGAGDMDIDDVEAGDDGFIDDLVNSQEEKDMNMPQGMANLLSAPLVSSNCSPVTGTSSFTLLKEDTPKQINAEARPRDLFNTAGDKEKTRPRSKSFALKRPNPPRDPNPMEKKRLRQRCMSLVESNSGLSPALLTRPGNLLKRSPFQRSNSEVFENRPNWQIGTFLGTESNRNLIGDFSKTYVLPSITGQHEDLKCISPETVTKLINGDYKDEIDEYYIIDCRYPFEFDGGHVKGAINIYTKDEMLKQFIDTPKCKEGKRVVVIFHCEFSSKRGPDMCRFLRNRDRDIHRPSYPSLFYPELYLLDGGYKNFFNTCKEHCEPQNYVLMLDENYSNDLKLFSKRSKSWSEGQGKKSFRPGLNYR